MLLRLKGGAGKMTSDQFREARQKLGLTQKQLGELMAIKQPHISIIEGGERQPTKAMAAHIRNLRKWKDREEFKA